MLVTLAFAFVAGALTILAPCTLPVVPLILGAAATGGHQRTLGILVGFGLTFIVATVLFASVLAATGLTTDRLRVASAVALGVVGLTLVADRVARWAERGLGPLAGLGTRLVGRRPGDGLIGGIGLGGAIGLVWAPCVGPIMAVVIAVAATHGPTIQTLVIGSTYVGGALVPIAVVARWGRRAGDRMSGAARSGHIRRAFGGAMLGVAVLVATGLDLTIENGVAGVLPAGWSGALVAVEQRPDIQQELDMLRTDRSPTPSPTGPSTTLGATTRGLPAPIATSLPAAISLEDLGPAPELAGISAWINSDPLTMASLRGKVVLVEFWTFGCINCIHVQPYVKAWYDRYASAGLVVVGVHTPELSFERDIGNVRDAVAKADLRYPVAFDPDFATWNAYRNNYWPAFFFIGKDGQIRHTHFGEGDYDGSEQAIRELLAEPG